uniref:Chitin-binding type-2 domain-containing protein n=1 Tax=Strongyloides venezuelensis TaxID=75913 RepID=A0A0K0EZ01_STRVS
MGRKNISLSTGVCVNTCTLIYVTKQCRTEFECYDITDTDGATVYVCSREVDCLTDDARFAANTILPTCNPHTLTCSADLTATITTTNTTTTITTTVASNQRLVIVTTTVCEDKFVGGPNNYASLHTEIFLFQNMVLR